MWMLATAIAELRPQRDCTAMAAHERYS